MLVQALAEYAQTYLAEQLAETAFEQKRVAYLLEIGKDGKFLGVVRRSEEFRLGNKIFTRAPMLGVSRSPVNRNTGIHPLSGCDDVKYVLGEGSWTKPEQRKNHRERHDGFVDLTKKAAGETKNPALMACASFYDQPDQVDLARARMSEEKAVAGDSVALSVEGPVIGRPAVRDWWSARYRRLYEERQQQGGTAMCLVSGQIGPIAPTHEKIKGLGRLGGQPSGVSLMSFDKDAFCSYGWKKNANSPTSPQQAMAYVFALNDLLNNSSEVRPSRRDVNGAAFVFWTRRPSNSADTWSLFYDANPEQVRSLLQLDPSSADLDPNDFYLAGLAGNGGRLLVRHWTHQSLQDTRLYLRAWFRDLAIADIFTGGLAKPPRLWQLLAATARDHRTVPANRLIQLVRRALSGHPLGAELLAAALGRQRAETGSSILNPVRAGLIRLCVNDFPEERKTMMNEQIQPTLDHPAYLCGRLLAAYDNLQYQTGAVNVSSVDRYYSLASTYPELAFPKIEQLGLKHLRKLRRDNRPAAFSIEKEIQEIHARLAGQEARFPSALSLADQGRFAIGFHHEKAEARRRAQVRAEAKLHEGNEEEVAEIKP